MTIGELREGVLNPMCDTNPMHEPDGGRRDEPTDRPDTEAIDRELQ